MQRQIFDRALSQQADSDSKDSSVAPTEAYQMRQLHPKLRNADLRKMRNEQDNDPDNEQDNDHDNEQYGTAFRRSKKCRNFKMVVIAALIVTLVQISCTAVTIYVVPILVDRQQQLHAKLNSYQTKQPIALKLTASSAPTQQVQMVKYKIDTNSAPKCISCSNCKQPHYPCWNNKIYMTNGSVGRLMMSKNYGDITQWTLTSDSTEIQVTQGGLFAIDAEIEVKIDKGKPAGISGGIHVQGSLRLACRETRPISTTTELILTCRIHTYEILQAGDKIKMQINSHQNSVQMHTENTYIKLVRL